MENDYKLGLTPRPQGPPRPVRDTLDVAKKTVADKQMGWPSWYDGEEIRGPIETDYNVPHWPRVYLIDPQGVIRYIDVPEKELDEAVEKLLAEAK